MALQIVWVAADHIPPKASENGGTAVLGPRTATTAHTPSHPPPSSHPTHPCAPPLLPIAAINDGGTHHLGIKARPVDVWEGRQGGTSSCGPAAMDTEMSAQGKVDLFCIHARAGVPKRDANIDRKGSTWCIGMWWINVAHNFFDDSSLNPLDRLSEAQQGQIRAACAAWLDDRVRSICDHDVRYRQAQYQSAKTLYRAAKTLYGAAKERAQAKTWRNDSVSIVYDRERRRVQYQAAKSRCRDAKDRVQAAGRRAKAANDRAQAANDRLFGGVD